MFPGFQRSVADVGGIRIPYVRAGIGPPLLLLHGHPQTHAIWHRVAPRLTRRFTVVASDLRGYGDATRLPARPDHSQQSKREMAADQVGLMRSLGFARFGLVGHDRGGRVGHRLAADHPQAVSRLMVLDIAPTLAMYEQTNQFFATAYWHWFFLIRPAPFPERMILSDPELYLRQTMFSRHGGQDVFAPDAWAEYLRCARDPAMVHAMCEDYRASATIDLDHDRADRDAGRRLGMPLRALWGAHGIIGRYLDPLAEWRRVAADVSGRAIDCGHYIPEEAPGALADEILEFFASACLTTTPA